MTYKELYESAVDKLEKSTITLGEFEKMIEPLNAEVATDINVGDKDTERKKAQWRAVRINPRMICCSNCNSGWWNKELIKALKFCPNCGADMEVTT